MSSIPKLRIYNSDGSSIQESWNAGELDIANENSFESNELVINVWNNRYGTEDVPDLVGCNITTKSIEGDNINSQVVTGQWVRVCVDTLASTDPSTGLKIFSPVGGDTICYIAAQGASSSEKTNHTLKGTSNDGAMSDNSKNYSKITLKVVPGLNAEPKVHYFKTRISGYYV